MSSSLFQRLYDFLDSENLTDGYTKRFYEWREDRENEEIPILLFAMDGAGGSDNEVIQTPIVDLYIIFNQQNTGIESGKMFDMLRALRSQRKIAGVIRFEPASTMIGPMTTKAGNKMFNLKVRCFTEDQ